MASARVRIGPYAYKPRPAHDQTLPQAIKLIVTLLIVMMLGPLFAHGIADQASSILDQFPVLTR